jgi:hypothetical protein
MSLSPPLSVCVRFSFIRQKTCIVVFIVHLFPWCGHVLGEILSLSGKRACVRILGELSCLVVAHKLQILIK